MTTQTIDAPVQAPVELKPLPAQFEVQVADEDIVLGVVGSTTQCPITRATRRTLALAGVLISAARVCRGDAIAWSDAVWREYHHDGWEFVHAFDDGLPVQPRVVRFWSVRP